MCLGGRSTPTKQKDDDDVDGDGGDQEREGKSSTVSGDVEEEDDDGEGEGSGDSDDHEDFQPDDDSEEDEIEARRNTRVRRGGRQVVSRKDKSRTNDAALISAWRRVRNNQPAEIDTKFSLPIWKGPGVGGDRAGVCLDVCPLICSPT